MSTKISALDERLKADIIGDEFFPIIDGGTGSSTATTGYQTFKIKLDTLFASGQGHEKVTGLALTADSNNQFILTYTKEDNSTNVITIDKYAIQDNDVAFTHIAPAGYITSTQTISNGNTNANDKLVTSAAVDEHVVYKENLLFNNSDSTVKTYFGDSSTSRTTGSHILKDFRLNTEVAQDFVNLQNGATLITTFRAVEQRFDLVDYSDKIGISQVNINHFRINTIDDSNRLNIKDLGIGTGLIANSAITTVKIKDNAVLNSKIVDDAITTRNIINDAVTTDKIIDEAITPAKLSGSASTPSLSPSWDGTAVNIPRSLIVSSDINAGGNVSLKGTTLSIYNSTNRGSGNSHQGRALVHATGDKLSINHLSDFTAGVNINGVVTVSDMSLANIIAGGNRSVITKEYVDRADILLNPIAEDKIQDDAVIHRHMTPDSVDTEELFDFCVTSPKVELVGPHWDSTGTVKIYNQLDVAGNKLEIGEPTAVGDKTEIVLRGPQTSSNLLRGFATITRNKGATGDLSIKNTQGEITFSAAGDTNLRITGTRAFIPKTLTISGDGSSTIAGTNFTNPPLLVGNSTQGIAVDQNEIIQKGNHLILGVSDGATQNIQFKEGVNTLATINGSTGNFTSQGDIITNTGNVKGAGTNSSLFLDGQGANIRLHGSADSVLINNANHSADIHNFSNQSGTALSLSINAKTKKVTLYSEGVNDNHLITKKYVDDKKIAPSDLTTGGPLWQSNGIVQTKNSLFVQSEADDTNRDSVGVHSRNIYGVVGRTDIDQKSKLQLKASSGGGIIDDASIQLYGTDHTLQNQVVIRGKQTQVQTITGTNALDIQEDGRILVPLQTVAFVNSHPRAVATKEWALTEIGKTFPDIAYVRRIGSNMLGDLTWSAPIATAAGETPPNGNGLSWEADSDYASIKFYTDGDQSLDNRLEFNIGDNGSENFLFTYTNTLGVKHNLLKVGQNNFSYKNSDVWYDGNTNGKVNSTKLATGAVTNEKLGSGSVTNTKILNNTITESKLEHISPGYVIGKSPIDPTENTNLVPISQSVTSTHGNIVTSQAIRNYVEAAIAAAIAAIPDPTPTIQKVVNNYIPPAVVYPYTTPVYFQRIEGPQYTLSAPALSQPYPAGVQVQAQSIIWSMTKNTSSGSNDGNDIHFYPEVTFRDANGIAISPTFRSTSVAYINTSKYKNREFTVTGSINIETFILQNTSPIAIYVGVNADITPGFDISFARHKSTIFNGLNMSTNKLT